MAGFNLVGSGILAGKRGNQFLSAAQIIPRFRIYIYRADDKETRISILLAFFVISSTRDKLSLLASIVPSPTQRRDHNIDNRMYMTVSIVKIAILVMCLVLICGQIMLYVLRIPRMLAYFCYPSSRACTIRLFGKNAITLKYVTILLIYIELEENHHGGKKKHSPSPS